MSNVSENIEITEEALVKGCIEDDRKYQEQLYKRYAKKMFVVCKSYARDRDEAMDFLQEGFIEVFRKLNDYRFEGSLEGWVRRVIVYKSIDKLRQEKRYQEVVRDFDEKGVSLPVEFELEEAKTDNQKKIRELVNQLPGKAGLILKLFVLEGLTHKEIAEHLEITEGTSKSQLNRARKLLKVALGK
jgi:RNA polymerase sigma-70 factor (ECF subfamily)